MAGVTVTGLAWYPLYWRHDDCWQFRVPSENGDQIQNHWGHVHFWMMGFNPDFGTDAFTGRQTYHFEIKDIWGPRSQDPNQQFQYRVVGTPRWYFKVTELWRRVYIQPWDLLVPVAQGLIVGRRGVKWDASSQGNTLGPFREGNGFAPVFIDGARTLPIEYFNTENKLQTQRDNYVSAKYAQALGPAAFGDGSAYVPPLDNALPEKPFPGAINSFADGLYITPTLEYQQVTQLDWERLPGFQAAHDIDNNNFGDGWSLDVTIPFTDPSTGKYRSPFAPAPGQVQPPGQYFNNLVSDANKMYYRAADNRPAVPPNFLGGYDTINAPFGLKDSQSGQLVQFQNPYGINDGNWVQQCLGGIVLAKAQVTIESKLGGRQDVWVETTQLLAQDQFAGTDQLLGAS